MLYFFLAESLIDIFTRLSSRKRGLVALLKKKKKISNWELSFTSNLNIRFAAVACIY